MHSALESARKTLETFLKKAGEHPGSTQAEKDNYVFRDEDWSLLTRSIDGIESWEHEDKKRNADLFLGAFIGFFECATDGYAFVAAEKIKERFGNTLKESYPEASISFLKFTTSYWTLKIVRSDLEIAHPRITLYHLLGKVEEDIADIFFPEPGPQKIPTVLREQKQEKVISKFAPRIDFGDFFRGNPILLRQKDAIRHARDLRNQ